MKNVKYILLRNILLMAVSGLLLMVSVLCTNNSNAQTNERELFICGQQTPQWFIDEVGKISKSSNLFKPIKIFTIRDEGIEYIAIENSDKNLREGLTIFTCEGTKIKPEESKYAAIVEKYKNNDAKIIWPDLGK